MFVFSNKFTMLLKIVGALIVVVVLYFRGCDVITITLISPAIVGLYVLTNDDDSGEKLSGLIKDKFIATTAYILLLLIGVGVPVVILINIIWFINELVRFWNSGV